MKSLNKKVSKAVSALAVAIALVGCDSGGGSNAAGLALAALGGAGYEATVVLGGKVKQTSGAFTATGGVNMFPRNAYTKPMYVKLSGSILASGGKDFTVAYASNNADAADFNLTFKINSSSGTLHAEVRAVPDATSCSGGTSPCDDPDNYTEAIGSFDLAVDIDVADPTNLAQFTISNEDGDSTNTNVATVSDTLSVALATGITSVKGVYSNPGATVGENKCDSIGNPEIVSGNITSNKTLGAFTLLRGTVTVSNGATVTAPAGAVIYGERGSSIFFNGANLVTNGTAANPVCFTSAQARGSRYPGDWGGIVIIGSGNNTRASQTTTEGTNPQNYPLSSGTASATLSYTIVEFAGTEVAPGEELNGISQYAVNSGNYNFVQVHRGLDDSFEWWGGGNHATNAPDNGTVASPNLTGAGGASTRTFRGKFLIGSGGMDDDFDMDEGFSGALKYIIAVKYPKTCGGSPSTDPGAMEMDGNDNITLTSQAYPRNASNPYVDHYTLLGVNETGSYGERHREGLQGLFTNGLAYGFVANVRCENTASFTTSTSLIDGLLSNDATDITTGSCTITNRSEALTTPPVTQIASTQSNCGFLGFKPDLRTNVSGSEGMGGAPADGNTLYDFDGTTVINPTGGNAWYSGWTVWRAR
ncbi:hypothetical protein [Leptospira koniambonensis]|uniref:hypothetical protein n=1 Tax=Leptospira koniambonensis TaxID=2484950 RepID=UPI003EBD3DAF